MIEYKKAKNVKKGDRVYIQALKTKVLIKVNRVSILDEQRVMFDLLDSSRVIFSQNKIVEIEKP